MSILKKLGIKKDKGPLLSEAPVFYQEYAALFETPLDKNLPLGDMSFAIVDTETTGLDHLQDEIVSIGGVILEENSIDVTRSLSLYLADRHVRDRKALEIHGLLPNEGFGEPETGALEKFLEFVGSRVIVGHYIGFDIRMINALLARHACPPLLNLVMDTSEFAKRMDFPMRNYQFAVNKQYTLDALCARFGIIPKARHTAAGDAYITAILFQKLMREFARKGIITLGDVLK